MRNIQVPNQPTPGMGGVVGGLVIMACGFTMQ
jgi:hypothetical protein